MKNRSQYNSNSQKKTEDKQAGNRKTATISTAKPKFQHLKSTTTSTTTPPPDDLEEGDDDDDANFNLDNGSGLSSSGTSDFF